MSTSVQYVCAECFDDDGLSEFISDEAESLECDFCGASSEERIAAAVDAVASYIHQCIETEYDKAANHLGYVSDEGGYQGRHWDTYDLLADIIGLDVPLSIIREMLFNFSRMRGIRYRDQYRRMIAFISNTSRRRS